MHKHRRTRRLLPLTGLASLALLLLGCGPRVSSLEFTSFKDPYTPERYSLVLDECAYLTGPGDDYHIVGHAAHTPAGGGEIQQYVHMHVFWKPWPGKTFDDSSSVDATIRYAIVTPQGAAVYCGTAFVYPKVKGPNDRVIAKVEDGRLRLESQQGQPTDVLGPTRVRGTLIARKNASLAMDLRRRLELTAGGATKPE